MKSKIKILCAVLCLILFIQIPLFAYGIDYTTDVTTTNSSTDDGTNNNLLSETTYNENAEIVEEDISKRGEYEKHFLQSDGTYLAVSYAEPVHKITQDGSFEEIDNTLSLKKGRLVNADDDFKVSFAEKSNNELVKISNDTYDLSWSLSSFIDEEATISTNDSMLQSINQSNNLNSTSTTRERTFTEAKTLKSAVIDEREDLELLDTKERKMVAEKASSVLVYNDILGDDIDARYTLSPGRVKEDIILNSPSDFSGYAMNIAAEDLTSVKTENNCVEFKNKDGEVIFTLQTPYMYDAADDISFDIDIEIEKTKDGYRIIFVPDSQWLNAKDRVYPIVIDPTITSPKNSPNAYDAYVYEGSGNTGSTVDRMYIGIRSVSGASKIHRAYWRIISLPSLPSDYFIISATFTGTHPSGTTTSRPFSLYGVDGTWTEGGITWANKPAETLLVSGVNRSNLTTTFSGTNVTQRVKDWYSGAKSNYGFMIRYTSESLTNPDYNSIWSCDNGSSSSITVPYLTINYDVATSYSITVSTVAGSNNVNRAEFYTTGAATVKSTNLTSGSDPALYNSSGSKIADDEAGNLHWQYTTVSGTHYFAGTYGNGAATYTITSTAPITLVRNGSNGSFNPVWPVSLHSVNSLWGWRPRNISSTIHRGIDIPVGSGTRVNTIEAGTVTVRGDDPSMGLYIRVNHGSGLYSQYLHLSSRLVYVGDSVAKGQEIAKSGNTGDSSGAHLHFEVFFNNTRDNAINPLTSYHRGDTRSDWTNPNPLFILSGSQYVYNSNFNCSYTANSYTSLSSTYNRGLAS